MSSDKISILHRRQKPFTYSHTSPRNGNVVISKITYHDKQSTSIWRMGMRTDDLKGVYIWSAAPRCLNVKQCIAPAAQR